MLTLMCYVILYYNIDDIFKNIYFPLINNDKHEELISSSKELYFLLTVTSYFMLFLYFCILIKNVFITKIIDRYALCLSFIYIKHISDIILIPKTMLLKYEMSRSIMWLFTTPLMIKMYCTANDLKLRDIKFYCHIIPIIPYIFIIPLKGTQYYALYTVVSAIPIGIFIRTLCNYRHLQFTNLFILIWSMFIFINLLEITNVYNSTLINSLYNLADTLSKFTFSVVIANHNEQEIVLKTDMDIQSVNFVSYMVKCIKTYKTDNKKLNHRLPIERKAEA